MADSKPQPCHSKSSGDTQGIVQTDNSAETSSADNKSNTASKGPPKKSSNKQRSYRKCRKHLEKLCKSRKFYDKCSNASLIRALLYEDESVRKLIRHMSPSFALKLQSQINILKKKAKYRRWKIGERIDILPLYLRNPTNYRLIRRLFCLPSPSNLKSLLNHFEFKEGINKKMFEVLKKNTRGFMLLFDVMQLRKCNKITAKSETQDHEYQSKEMTASHALVFMLGGITKKNKEPVAYYLSNGFFTAEQIAASIREVLHACFNYGLNMRGTICNLSKNNKDAFAILGATVEKPCIQLCNKEIVCMFDPHNLVTLFRDMFMKYDIKWTTNFSFFTVKYDGTGIAKWSHIKQCYEHEKMSKFKFAEAITEKEISPNRAQRKKFKYANHVFSVKSVMAITSCIHNETLPREALVTADIIRKIEVLIQAFNSDSSTTDPDIAGAPLEYNLSYKSPHLKLFEETKPFFNNLELIDCTHKPLCLEGWIWTLNAVKELLEIYKKKRTTKSIRIPTQRLRLEPLRDSFDVIRAYCGPRRPWSAGQFINALKLHILTNVKELPPHPYEDEDENAYEPVVDKIFLNFYEVTRKERHAMMYAMMHKEMNKWTGF